MIKRIDNRYRKYIASDAWRKKAEARKEIDGNKCALCGKTEGLQVHHKHYRTFMNENVEQDLITLCKDCHNDVHEEKEWIIDGIVVGALIMDAIHKDGNIRGFLKHYGINSNYGYEMYREHIDNGLCRLAIPIPKDFPEEGAIVMPFYSQLMAEKDIKKYADYAKKDIKELESNARKIYYIVMEDGGVIDDFHR